MHGYQEPVQHVQAQDYSVHVSCIQLLWLQVFEEGQPVKCNALAYWEFKVGGMLLVSAEACPLHP